MIVTIQQIQLALATYVEHELAKKATGIMKFGIYFILPKIPKYVLGFVGKYIDNPFFKDMFDENGNVKIDEVYNTAKEAIRKSGQIEMFGFVFNETDIDKLYTYIKQTGATV